MYKNDAKSYGEIGINKNVFHKATTSISIDKIGIKKIVLFDKTSYGNNDLSIILERCRSYITIEHKTSSANWIY